MNGIEKTAALWYRWTALGGLFFSVLVFLLYGFGLMPTDYPASASPEYWGSSAAEYRQESGRPFGPGWFLRIDDGAAAAAAPALLAGSAMPVLIALTAAFFRRGEKLYGFLCLGVFLLLILAAAAFP